MNRHLTYILLVLTITLSAGCDKTKRTRKKLDGEWSILSYEYMNPSGFTYKYSAQGTFIFNDSKSEELSTFKIEMDYEGPAGSTAFHEEGFYKFSSNNWDRMDLYRVNSDTITDTINDAWIVLITKDDLKFEYSDNLSRKTFIMAK